MPYAARPHSTPFDRLLTPDGRRNEVVLDLEDLGNVDQLFAVDFLLSELGIGPRFPMLRYSKALLRTPSQFWWSDPIYDRERSDAQLAYDMRALRNAVLLPLCEELLHTLRSVLALAEIEAERRIKKAAYRARHQDDRYQRWEDFDLLSAVEAVAGPGKQRGRDHWFSCPWHEDRTPSLHVDAVRKIWRCFSCARGGGVVSWRKAIEGRAA